jgi:hypothetical protein
MASARRGARGRAGAHHWAALVNERRDGLLPLLGELDQHLRPVGPRTLPDPRLCPALSMRGLRANAAEHRGTTDDASTARPDGAGTQLARSARL